MGAPKKVDGADERTLKKRARQRINAKRCYERKKDKLNTAVVKVDKALADLRANMEEKDKLISQMQHLEQLFHQCGVADDFIFDMLEEGRKLIEKGQKLDDRAQGFKPSIESKRTKEAFVEEEIIEADPSAPSTSSGRPMRACRTSNKKLATVKKIA